jgi:hypothetical protein
MQKFHLLFAQRPHENISIQSQLVDEDCDCHVDDDYCDSIQW